MSPNLLVGHAQDSILLRMSIETVFCVKQRGNPAILCGLSNGNTSYNGRGITSLIGKSYVMPARLFLHREYPLIHTICWRTSPVLHIAIYLMH